MKHSVYFAAIVVFCWAMYSLFRIGTTLAPDFSVFYDAARGLLNNQNIYTLPMYTGLGYPPFTLLPFLPFTILPYQMTQFLWLGISFSSFILCIFVSLRLLGKKPNLFPASLVFIFAFLAFPTKFTFGMGQANFVALALLLAAIWHLTKKNTTVSGICLGLALILKPHILFFLPVILLAGYWRSVVISLSLLATSIVATGFVFGWQHYAYYFRSTIPPLLVFSGRDIYYNQGLGSFLTRQSFPRGLAADLTVWGSALLVVGALWFVWQKRLSLAHSLFLFLPIFLLVEPLSWQHHYVFLLPVYIWLVFKAKRNKRKLALIALSYLLVAANFRNPATWQMSHVFWGNVLVLWLVAHETT